jgi:SAM-dependent methyltransferase
MCLEIIEHLLLDPMHMMSEINRALKPGGLLLLSTPNADSMHALARLLAGHCPMHTPQYFAHPYSHNHEFGYKEVHRLFEASGMAVAEYVGLTTGRVGVKLRMLELLVRSMDLVSAKVLKPRQMHTYHLMVGRKVGPVRDRCPEWLYQRVAAEAIQARPAGAGPGAEAGALTAAGTAAGREG